MKRTRHIWAIASSLFGNNWVDWRSGATAWENLSWKCVMFVLPECSLVMTETNKVSQNGVLGGKVEQTKNKVWEVWKVCDELLKQLQLTWLQTQPLMQETFSIFSWQFENDATRGRQICYKLLERSSILLDFWFKCSIRGLRPKNYSFLLMSQTVVLSLMERHFETFLFWYLKRKRNCFPSI